METRHLLDRTGFTVATGRAAGLSRKQLDAPRMQRPFRGVRTIEADLGDHRARCRAYAARNLDGHVFSHNSAAVLHGLPLPRHAVPREVHVAVFTPRKPPQMRGVIAHQLRAAGHRVVDVDGLPVVSAEDTWAQLSSSLGVADLVVIGDWLITGDEPYSGRPSPWSRDDLERALRHHGRRPGVRALRMAFEAVRFGPLSPQESRLRIELTGAGLPEPRLNHRVEVSGRVVAMVDLAYPDRRVAIEYLGDHHRSDQSVYRDDIHRRERLAQAGWETVFLTADDLAGPVPRAILAVRRALARSLPD